MEVAYAVAFWGSVNGKITSPYWLGWYGPRSRSAIFQIRLALVCAMVRVELWATCLGATNAVIGEDAVRRRRTIR